MKKTSEKPIIIQNPLVRTDEKSRPKLEDMYQVVLHNDDAIFAYYVVECLIRVFRHDSTMAFKIMMEAHRNGCAIAEVEAKNSADKHCAQLHSSGIPSTVEKI